MHLVDRSASGTEVRSSARSSSRTISRRLTPSSTPCAGPRPGPGERAHLAAVAVRVSRRSGSPKPRRTVLDRDGGGCCRGSGMGACLRQRRGHGTVAAGQSLQAGAVVQRLGRDGRRVAGIAERQTDLDVAARSTPSKPPARVRSPQGRDPDRCRARQPARPAAVEIGRARKSRKRARTWVGT